MTDDELLFTEVFRIDDGHVSDLTYNEVRMKTTGLAFGFDAPVPDISDSDVPRCMRKGVVKGRILYGRKLVEVSFSHYERKDIRSLMVVNGDDTDYGFKYADRSCLASLYAMRCFCDDVLIVKNGMVCDTSFCNILLDDGHRLVTPSTCLLPGTRRQALIDSGAVAVVDVPVSELYRYRTVLLVNAMMGIDNCIVIPTCDIHGYPL